MSSLRLLLTLLLSVVAADECLDIVTIQTSSTHATQKQLDKFGKEYVAELRNLQQMYQDVLAQSHDLSKNMDESLQYAMNSTLVSDIEAGHGFYQGNYSNYMNVSNDASAILARSITVGHEIRLVRMRQLDLSLSELYRAVYNDRCPPLQLH